MSTEDDVNLKNNTEGKSNAHMIASFHFIESLKYLSIIKLKYMKMQ